MSFSPRVQEWVSTLALNWLCYTSIRDRERWKADVVWLVNSKRRHQTRLNIASDADDNLFLPNVPLHSLDGADVL